MNQALENIERHFENHEFKKTIVAANAYLKQAPQDVLALYLRGMSHEGLGDVDDAMADYQRVLTIDPDFRAAALQHARCQLGKFNIAEALDELDVLAEKYPDWISVFEERASAHQVDCNYMSQADDLLRVIELGGETAAVRYDRFIALDVVIDHETACKELDRAIEIDPENESYRRQRAKHHPDDKIKVADLKWLVERYPNDTELEASLILYLASIGHMAAVNDRIAAMERRLGKLPAGVHSMCAALASDQGDHAKAAYHADKYLEAVPLKNGDSVDALMMGEYYFRADRLADAEKLFSIPESEFGEDSAWIAKEYEVARRCWLSRCRLRQNRKEDAQRIFDEALRLSNRIEKKDHYASDLVKELREEFKETII